MKKQIPSIILFPLIFALPLAAAPDSKSEIDQAVLRVRAAWEDSISERLKKSVDREALAEELFTRLDPRKFLHPTETASPSLKFLKAQVSIKAPDLDRVAALIDKKDWLALVNYGAKKDYAELPEPKKIISAAEIFGGNEFYIHIKPGIPVFRKIKTMPRFKECLLPKVFFTESEDLRLWETSLVKTVGEGNAPYGWVKHPDAGYFLEWSPDDGPVVFVIAFHAFENTDSAFLKSLSNDRLYMNLEKKKKLGELDEKEAQMLWLQGKEAQLRRFYLWAAKR